VRAGVLRDVWETLAQDLKERGELVLSECFIDGTFIVAKRADTWERPSGAKARSSWQYQTLLVFLSPRTQRVLRRMSLPCARHSGASLVDEWPQHLIGDKAYDSDKLDEQLAAEGVEMIAPHRKNRKPENKTQDGRPLRRYKRRWKVERLFAWLQNFRRVLTRFDFYPGKLSGFVHLACIKILLNAIYETACTIKTDGKMSCSRIMPFSTTRGNDRLRGPRRKSSRAEAINDSGQVCGGSLTDDGSFHAFLYENVR
jgi:probable HAF family extracellular repeat protein